MTISDRRRADKRPRVLHALRRAAIAVAAAAFATTANAAVHVQTWHLPADYEAFGIIDYSLPHFEGPTRLTLRSSRAVFGEFSVYAYQEVHYHETPSDGSIGYGYRGYQGTQTDLRAGTLGFTVDYTTSEREHYSGCCVTGHGGNPVSYIAETYYRPLIFIDFTFAPGSDPITVTMTASPAPEPVTWSMMIVGFGLSGMALRHSRRRAFA